MKRIFRVAIVLSVLASTLSIVTTQTVNAVVATNPSPVCSAGNCTVTFSFAGDFYAWTVPSGVTSLTFDVIGAAAPDSRSAAKGGNGGRTQGTLTTTPGQILYFYVGGLGGTGSTSVAGSGGWNGGGAGGYYGVNNWGTGGGGASDIRTTVGNLGSRLVVAGGGGGAACNGCSATADNGGAGGGLIGAPGFSAANSSIQSGGGTQSAGGAGNQWSGWNASTAGTAGNGGVGATGTAGGGGGGGLYGGGGGSWVGGGGGSSYTHPTLVQTVTHSQGYNTSNGSIAITYLNSPIPTTFSTTQTSPTNIGTGSTISYSLILSQSVSDLTASDFQFGGTSTCNTPGLSGSTTTYTVTVTNCTEGTLILQLKANSITGTSTGPPTVSSANTVVIDRTAPTITSVIPPANKTYFPNETATFTMNFSESITMTGTPILTLLVGAETRSVQMTTLADARTGLFVFTVPPSLTLFDTDGIEVVTTLNQNSAVIRDLASNNISNLTFPSVNTTSIFVAQIPAAPTIDSITATSGTLTVYFRPGASNGSAITSYQYATIGSTFKTRLSGTTESPLVITVASNSTANLVNGTGYPIRLRAVSAAGSGNQSDAVTETPTAIVVSGNSTLNLAYGNSASTSAYSASGGTNTYSWSLGSSLTGVTLSGTTVTASSSTPVGTYSQTVRATDGNSQVGTRSLTITVNKASTSITIALPSSATTAPLGGAVTITATVPRAGSVNFRLGGSTLIGCGSAAAASTTATCSWTPVALGAVSLTAIFTPTDITNYETSTTTTLAITVVNGVSAVTLSLAGGVTQVPKGQTINIIANIDQIGRITFLVDGKRIPGCNNLLASVIGNRSCSWKPAIQKTVNISARLVPTNSVFNPASSNLAVQVVRRSGLR